MNTSIEEFKNDLINELDFQLKVNESEKKAVSEVIAIVEEDKEEYAKDLNINLIELYQLMLTTLGQHIGKDLTPII